MLPPDLARLLWDNRVALSPFTWVAAWPSLMWAGIALLAAAALCLALGVYPRLAALAAWGLLAALQERNPGLYMVWGSLSGLFQHGDLHARFGQTLGSGVACSR